MPNKKNFYPKKVIIADNNAGQNVNIFDILESAWNDLPQDMSHEERQIFIEIVGKLIKDNSDINNSYSSKKNIRKN